MNYAMAKLSAITSLVLVVAAVIILYVTSHPGAGATTVKAEFKDAFPILAGMNVRESGAIAGSVRDVSLTDHGTALLTLSLNAGTEPPRGDAIAAIRQQDVTGDSYVSLSPGSSSQPLAGATIPASRTLAAPRFDDLLNSFGSKEREALRLVLVETGTALEANGNDVNRAALELSPALSAANQVTAEIASQNQALRRLVSDGAAVTGQAAAHSRQLGGLIDSLSATLRTTADHSTALDSGLAALPRTASLARGTLTHLRRTAVAARPLADALSVGAPQLATTLKRLGPFLGGARHSLRSLQPTVSLAADTLHQGQATFQAAPKSVVTAPFELAGSIDDLLRALLGNENVLKTLFGADANGSGPSKSNDVGLGAVSVEKGNQAGYAGNDPARNFLRAMVIPSCEMFGLPIAPGCLARFLATVRSGARGASGAGKGNAAPPNPAGALQTGARPGDATGSPPQLGGLLPPTAPGHNQPGSLGGASGLLDFLLGK